MNPQEQNKPKAPFLNPSTPGIQKNDASKSPAAANIQPGTQDKNSKDAPLADKNAETCSTTKGSCGTK